MNIFKDLYYIVFILQIIITTVSAQSINISGRIIDKETKEPLQYGTVFLKKHAVGVLTDENGKFSLFSPYNIINDTLIVNSLGYSTSYTEIKNPEIFFIIELDQEVGELSEVEISPLSPTDYIRNAMRNLEKVKPDIPYMTLGYYFEKITENNMLLRHDEGVFKTYIPSSQDSLKRRQYQLVLYRKGENIQPMKFMLEKRSKEEIKENEKAKKENKEPKTGIDFVFTSGGPPVMMRYVSINKWVDDYLDTTMLKHFEYSFSNSRNGAEENLIVIDFKSKGVVNHSKRSGKIYIHLPTNTVLKIEGQGTFVIPLILRPLMFIYGFNTKNLSFTGVKEYETVDGKWYFKNAEVKAKVSVTKKHLFSENEDGDFIGDQRYSIVRMWQENAKPIDSTLRYNHEKIMEKQVHNDMNLKWEDIRILNPPQ